MVDLSIQGSLLQVENKWRALLADLIYINSTWAALPFEIDRQAFQGANPLWTLEQLNPNINSCSPNVGAAFLSRYLSAAAYLAQ